MAVGRRIVWRREMRYGGTYGGVRSSKMDLRLGKMCLGGSKMLWRREMWRWRDRVRDRRRASEVGSRRGDGNAGTSDSERCGEFN